MRDFDCLYAANGRRVGCWGSQYIKRGHSPQKSLLGLAAPRCGHSFRSSERSLDRHYWSRHSSLPVQLICGEGGGGDKFPKTAQCKGYEPLFDCAWFSFKNLLILRVRRAILPLMAPHLEKIKQTVMKMRREIASKLKPFLSA